MTLDRLVFDHLLFYPFMYGTVMAMTSVRSHIFDVVVMLVVVKGGLFNFIGSRHMKN